MHKKLEEWHHLEFSHHAAFMFSAFVINFSFSFLFSFLPWPTHKSARNKFQSGIKGGKCQKRDRSPVLCANCVSLWKIDDAQMKQGERVK